MYSVKGKPVVIEKEIYFIVFDFSWFSPHESNLICLCSVLSRQALQTWYFGKATTSTFCLLTCHPSQPSPFFLRLLLPLCPSASHGNHTHGWEMLIAHYLSGLSFGHGVSCWWLKDEMEVMLDGYPSLWALGSDPYYRKCGHDPSDTVTFPINYEYRQVGW